MPTTTPSHAAIYARISLALDGSTLGVDRQEEACRRWAQERGWSVAEVLVDNSISASKDAHRPAYERLKDGIRSGEFDGVVVWALDRVDRRARHLLAFADLIRDADVPVGVVSGSELDLTTPSGRLMLTIAAGVAENETAMKAERQKLAAAQRREQGRDYGRVRAFGWKDARKLQLHPEESALILKGAEDYLAGKTLTELVREWNATDLRVDRTPSVLKEKIWRDTTIRRILTRPANAGLLAHHGEVIGSGDWTPIYSVEMWERLEAHKRSRTPTAPKPTADYVLSGVMTCALCGGRMTGGSLRGVRRYVCSIERDASISAHFAERPVLEYVRRRLLSLRPGDVLPLEIAEESSAVSRELLELDDERDDVMRTEGLSSRSRTLLLADIDKKAERLRSTLTRLSRGAALASLVTKATEWDSLSVAQQRAVIGLLGRYVVSPGRGEERVSITPREPMHGGLMIPEDLDDEDRREIELLMGAVDF